MRVTRLFVASLRSRFSRRPRLASKLRLRPEASTIMSAPLQGSAASSPMRTIPLLRQAQGVSGSAFPRGTRLRTLRKPGRPAQTARAPLPAPPSVRAARARVRRWRADVAMQASGQWRRNSGGWTCESPSCSVRRNSPIRRGKKRRCSLRRCNSPNSHRSASASRAIPTRVVAGRSISTFRSGVLRRSQIIWQAWA